jgi:DNA-binding XRE family transcriptional regulator
MSDLEHPTTYGELADILVKLPVLVRETRRQRRLSQRAAAAQIGIAPSTVCRFEQGAGLDLDNVIAILHWFDHIAQPSGQHKEQT